MSVVAYFGQDVFSDREMKKRLKPQTYESLKRTQREAVRLDPSIAEEVAEAMKDWAVERGATHFSHWFQPLTGITAGKLESFILPTGDGGAIMRFSSKALVVGEPDASSFPSGGLRATFEARGYTAWDPTSPVFVRGETLFIPTAFCSYSGDALDNKTPLLRSVQAVNTQALRLLRALGNTTSHHVDVNIGVEQEYFLIDRKNHEARLDLKICGRTLMGARAAKGQELDDHYCGRIRLRVGAFMQAVDEALWKLGIGSQTRHNEVAPAQHELAPMYGLSNIAADQNQLIMETLRIEAKKRGLACLLHEKPFEGINGSGKHNNYSLCTDDGIQFLRPGSNPAENKLFLVSLCAFISAVDKHADLLRLSAATPGNDTRLGVGEAPPAIVSIFLGDALLGLLEQVASGTGTTGKNGKRILGLGVDTLPDLFQDDADRNRTSPFAFTGNKFEFRMLGSSQSVAFANVILNTIVAEAMDECSTFLETEGSDNVAISHLVARTLDAHRRIIFNGDNYTEVWREEARRRGLPVFRSCVDVYDVLTKDKNIELFERYGILSRNECTAFHDIYLEHFSKVGGIEASTLLEMAKREILPCAIRYLDQMADTLDTLNRIKTGCSAVSRQVKQLTGLIDELSQALDELTQAMDSRSEQRGHRALALYTQNTIRPLMERVRLACDRLEVITDKSLWPVPTYTDLLHRI